MKQITSKLSLPNIIPQNHSKKLPKKRIKKRNIVNESSRPVLSHDRYVYWKGKQNFYLEISQNKHVGSFDE
ncbi:unnamed protein product [Rhizophagus irregularis]|nr:unnamed protein product [Rhizophagus irregularis]CAB5352470.1 unnamed protein product [Rhizophagus irregularis]